MPSKALAEHFLQIKYAQLNFDVFTGTVAVDWEQMREEYTHYKKAKGDKQATLYETALTLSHFERLIGRCNSKQITQNTIDKLILDKGKEIKRSTLNKDIRKLRAFIHWCSRRGDIESWRVSELDFENSYVTTRSTKTKKSMGSKPVPIPIMVEFKKYVSGLDSEQKVFKVRFNDYKWKQIHKKPS